jgi:hypothetical protein
VIVRYVSGGGVVTIVPAWYLFQPNLAFTQPNQVSGDGEEAQ